jgi:hypothetical protein
MNGNIGKIALLVAIIVMAPVVLSAGQPTTPPGLEAIQGQYVGGGTTTCVFAACGFDPAQSPLKVPRFAAPPGGGWGSGAWSVSTQSHLMVMTLKQDGTGTVSQSIWDVTFNNRNGLEPWPSVKGENKGTSYGTGDITYTVTSDGTLAIEHPRHWVVWNDRFHQRRAYFARWKGNHNDRSP